MTTDTRTQAEFIAVLAAATMTCPECVKSTAEVALLRFSTCLICQGSGHVPRFRDKDGRALFRVPCTAWHTLTFSAGPSTSAMRNAACHEIGCKGWSPLPENDQHLETLAVACSVGGYTLRVVVDSDGGGFSVEVYKSDAAFYEHLLAKAGGPFPFTEEQLKLEVTRALVATVEAER